MPLCVLQDTTPSLMRMPLWRAPMYVIHPNYYLTFSDFYFAHWTHTRMPLHSLAGCPRGRACAGGPRSSLTHWRPTLARWGAHGHALGAYAHWGHVHTLGGMCTCWGAHVRVGGCVYVLGGVHTYWGVRVHVWGCVCVLGHVHSLGGTYMSGAHAYVGGRHACMQMYLLCCSY